MRTFSNAQAGLSLIELMVALAISSFLVLGIAQLYVDNKNGFLFNSAQIENQENSRYTFMILDQELSKVGYRRRPDQPFEAAFPPSAGTPAQCSFNAGQTVALPTSGGGLCIRYQPRDRNDRDCLGNLPTSSAVPSTPYTDATVVIMEKFTVSANGDLLCAVGSDDAQTVLSGLSDIQFEYGVGPATSDRLVDTYTATPGSLPIRAIRYSALMASSLNVRKGGDSLTLSQWKSRYPSSTPNTSTTFDSGQLFQVAQGTITFRNLLQ
ncbi:prepilin-type N-terminal cleavage/methylation domain-containing protein [Pseudomonas nitroreducens]|uniref:prepilin-type N-terminal cleavage/methylation domain-containing protein n=1 Tax=Pseudomonas aeruginosa group TaxID=136841 RepID=UPI001472742E|nr:MULTISPECIES: prepilin-type N-terminal cleavage/methylation domain-containing protein [Pseudomonas aeruginosa group]NMZ74992.1 prepilin-type N-terminal cleavage/methylation domain-containing protein [Pseudomonas nitroreducens]